jgi:hypothetical protein
MSKRLDPALIDILKTYEIDANDALWDCHGTWVMYHRYIEIVAAKAGVSFDPPVFLETDTASGIVSLHCTGRLGDRSEWSVGECSPKNNKNAYPYAMAEKRAKDRVVLKLVGLSGFVYSEEESDDFKKKQSSAQLKRDDVWPTFEAALNDCQTEREVDRLKAEYRDKVKKDRWPKAWVDSMADAFAMKIKVLEEFTEIKEEAA